MKAVADRKDYKRGYLKHYTAYKMLVNEDSTVSSRRLLLVYSVECGLKYKLLEKWRLLSIANVIQNAQDKRGKVLGSHDLRILLKELGQEGKFHLSPIKTVHREIIAIKDFHQICRYGINVKNESLNKMQQNENELNKIAEWLKEVI